jgi:hypothetical protein
MTARKLRRLSASAWSTACLWRGRWTRTCRSERSTREGMVVTTVALDAATHRRLKVMAVKKNTVLTELVRDAVRDWLRRKAGGQRRSRRGPRNDCAIYARKSTEQNGVSDEARSVTRQIEPPDSMRRGGAGRLLMSTSRIPSTDECAEAAAGLPGARHERPRPPRSREHSDALRDDSTRVRVMRAIATAEVEQQQLVAAVTAGGADVSALVVALRERQERLVHLRAQLHVLSAPPPSMSCDRDALRQAVHARLVDRRGLLRANTTEARRIIAKLLNGRLTFTPRRVGQREFYEFSGTGTIRAILEGIVDESITRAGVPNGIRTRVLALKGPRPRPLDDGDSGRVRNIKS